MPAYISSAAVQERLQGSPIGQNGQFEKKGGNAKWTWMQQ